MKLKKLIFLILKIALLYSKLSIANDLCVSAILNGLCHNLAKANNLSCEKTVKMSNDKHWELEWSDEFNYSGKPDPNKWKYETGAGVWGNDELQNYTNRKENSYVSDGNLVIVAKREDFEKSKFTSARLNSTRSATYGRYEIRAKLPTTKGTWSAVWMLPDKVNYGTTLWLDNGEIDIVETLGHNPNINMFSQHTLFYNYWNGNDTTSNVPVKDGIDQYHKYVIEWMPNYIKYYLDDKLVYSTKKETTDDWKKWPFDQDFHLIMNLAVGGSRGGEQGIDENGFPAKMYIDYIRVFRPTMNNPDCK